MKYNQRIKSSQQNSFIDRLFRLVASPLFLRLSIVWFIFQTLFMSLSTRLGVSPDETYHYNFIKLFAHNGWLPVIHSQSGYYSLGEVKHTPFFLYHYLLSLPLHIIGSWHSVEILRLINIGLAVWSLTLFVKLARRLKIPSLITNLSIFMLVNTLMFVFLSGSINYDNLLIPVSLLSFILLFDFLDKPSFANLYKLYSTCLAGSLIVINFLPILLVIFFIVIYVIFFQVRDRRGLRLSWSNIKSLNKFVLVLGILLSIMFLQRYAINIVRYHSFSPSCLRINTSVQCSQDGTISRLQTLPKRINHPHPTPFEYFTDWVWSMRSSTYGILGHESINDNKIIRVWSELYLIGGLVATIRYYRPSRNWNIIIGLGIVYTMFLFAKIYKGYYQTGYNFGIQGRYFFIFLPFVYYLFNLYSLEMMRRRGIQGIFIIITLVVFAFASLPTYIFKTDPTWYKSSRSTRVNYDIRRLEQKVIKF